MSRRYIDDESQDDAHDGPKRPVPTEPVLNGGVPEQSRGQKDKTQNRPQNRCEHSLEPVSENPEQYHNQPGKKESDESEKAASAHFALPPCCPFYQETPTAVPR